MLLYVGNFGGVIWSTGGVVLSVSIVVMILLMGKGKMISLLGWGSIAAVVLPMGERRGILRLKRMNVDFTGLMGRSRVTVLLESSNITVVISLMRECGMVGRFPSINIAVTVLMGKGRVIVLLELSNMAVMMILLMRCGGGIIQL